MTAIGISLGLLVALFAILLFYEVRKLEPQAAGYGSQRMCPSCGLVTSRLKACCLECGKSLTAVSVTRILEK
jgi:predicted amidophosphoribosyltransferase